jgi:hypothetical protein
MLLKEEFWGITFEDYRSYNMDILGRLHVKRNMKQQNFIMI